MVANQVNACPNVFGQIQGQFIISAIHPTPGCEIAAHKDGCHGVPVWHAAACNAPARNQYCKPIWVVNGVNPRINATTPRLTATIAEAEKRRPRERVTRAIRMSFRV